MNASEFHAQTKIKIGEYENEIQKMISLKSDLERFV